MREEEAPDLPAARSQNPEVPRQGQRSFLHILANTAVANLTTSYLWFALTFWVYLETENVMATGIIGGAFMLLIAGFSMIFGTIVDNHRKKSVFVFSALITAVAFALAGLIYHWLPTEDILNIGGWQFWIFCLVILFGAIVEQMRGIALSTTVTLLIPVERHANANGLVGTVQGIAFIITSVFSGLSIGLLGMGWTLVIAIAMVVITLLHLLGISIPEQEPEKEEGLTKTSDLCLGFTTVMAIPGLFALIIFSMFNNFIGGIYMALMDPYGLTIMPVEAWGITFGLASTGFIIGGLAIAKFGLGPNPIRTMLLLVAIMGFLGAVFTIREWTWLYVLGIWLYMMLIPAVEASEQTVIQKVVAFRRQGRVFGFAQMMEAAAAPITAFLVAPLAQYLVIPYMRSTQGDERFGWLVGQGQARGIALIFLVGGLIMVVAALLAMGTGQYRKLSAIFQAESPATPQEASVANESEDPSN
ncbi:MFS transporter [Glutamicibacter arilaitensis]|uniref:MFS transporter n=1 Tax=Glutamicibacter arilaitensis TaxID=256701 RepID=A0A4Y8TUF0_9MICC|nr:MFS transporter [Glutamicibacter arilaitensis]TFH55805.1 MFS transporter [Glutamicibacter arilaitensis]